MRPQCRQRFLDPGVTLHELGDLILVVCPGCQGCARVVPRTSEPAGCFAPRRLLCDGCGLLREYDGGELYLGSIAGTPVDPYFSLPLWLRTDYRGKTLWAYNLRHLGLMEAFVSASLREHRRREELGWQNQSLINRLPKWLKAGKNRGGVLRAIGRLKQTLIPPAR